MECFSKSLSDLSCQSIAPKLVFAQLLYKVFRNISSDLCYEPAERTMLHLLENRCTGDWYTKIEDMLKNVNCSREGTAMATAKQIDQFQKSSTPSNLPWIQTDYANENEFPETQPSELNVEIDGKLTFV